MGYSISIKDTNKYLMPIHDLWKLQQKIVEKDLDADDWEWVDAESFSQDSAELKRKLDNHEFDYPCGEKNLERPEAMAWKTSREGLAEVEVSAKCKECGWRFNNITQINLEI